MSPFQPKGETARWRLIYQELQGAAIGDVVTYERLGKVLELDPDADRQKIQMAVRRAAEQYLKSDKRALDVVPTEGYQIVDAVGHIQLARRHQSKAAKELVKGHAKSVNVDLAGVDPEVKHALEVVARGFAVQMDFNRRFDVRQKRLEDALNSVSQQASRSEEEIAELRARLERLEEAP
jgi:predicted FMN-binding regulatory protein PaiB